MLGSDRLKLVVERNMEPATREFEIGSKVLYSRYRPLSKATLASDALMTPFLYGYNHGSLSGRKSVKTCCGDMPILAMRDIFARNLKLDQA